MIALLARRFVIAALAAAALAFPVRAQTGPAADWRAELDRILGEIAVTEERQDELQRELADLDRDRAGLAEALIETNRRVQELEGDLDAIEERLAALAAEEATVRAALGERRDVLAEVLAVLQRMGQAPPPAIVIRPEDALAAVRGAILLGAVVPEIRGEAEALVADIERLIALRAEQETERDRIVAAANEMADEQARLELLIGERQQALAQTGDTLLDEQERLGTLAAMAGTLEELIAAFEGGTEPAVGLAYAPATPAEPGPPVILGEADRIDPAVPFASARGLLPRPVNGDLLLGFGAEDGLGGRTRGQSIETRPGARVAAPADGWVQFAGPYRSYGNLLIIDAGGGYHIVLAGMERIDVQRGQFVLAGEPVGAMRSAQVAALADAQLGAVRPVLYVEFRRDGEAINPDPWWADPY